MKLSDYVKECCKVKGVSHLADVSRVTGIQQTTLWNKYNRNNLTNKDLEAIAEALGATLEIKFIDKETGKPVI